MGFKDFFFNTDSNTKQPVSQAKSRGLKEDWTQTFPTTDIPRRPYLGERPDFSIEKARELYKEDPVVRAAVKKTVNKVLQTGWRLQPQNDKSGVKKLRQKFKDRSAAGLDYEKHLEEVAGNLVLYNNAFVEVIEQNDEKYVNLLEPEFMEINTQLNGDVNYYFQDVPVDAKTSGENQQDKPEWNPDEVVHYKLSDFSTNAWARLDLEAIYETLLIKDYIRQWLHWFFKTNQMRAHVRVGENATEDDINEILSDLKAMQNKANVPFPTQGDVQVEKFLDFTDNEAAGLRDMLDWCDEQLLILLQVPPVMLGKGDESGRSTASELRKQFDGYIQGIRRTISRYEYRELYPKLGAPAVELKWDTVDRAQHKEIFETVRSMRQAQFKPAAIQEYLESQGVFFDTDDVFFSKEELAQMSNKELGTGNESIKGNTSTDEAQSRERQVEEDVQRGNQ